MNRKRSLINNIKLATSIFFNVKNWWLVWLEAFNVKYSASTINLRNNLKFNFRPGTGDVQEIAMLSTNYEYPWDLMLKLCSPDTILDLGSHIGVFAIKASSLWPNVRIIAVEPIPQNIELLTSNIKLNNKQIELAPVAISNMQGQINFSRPLGDDSWHIDTNGEYVVQAITLTNLFEQFNITTAGMIKMDIEGAEYSVLTQAKDKIKQCELVVLEFHASTNNVPNAGQELNFLNNYFKDLGFKVNNYSDHILLAYK